LILDAADFLRARVCLIVDAAHCELPMRPRCFASNGVTSNLGTPGLAAQTEQLLLRAELIKT
jgi:hypothetical protein